MPLFMRTVALPRESRKERYRSHVGLMSRMDSRPMWSKFSGIRGPPIAAASKDKKGWEGFLDKVGLKLDKWEVEKQESSTEYGKRNISFICSWTLRLIIFSWGKKPSYTMKRLSSMKEVTKQLKNTQRRK